MTSEHQCSNCVPNEEIIDTAPLYRPRSDREPQIVDMLVSVQTQYVPRHEADALRAELAAILAAAHNLAEAIDRYPLIVASDLSLAPNEQRLVDAIASWRALNVGAREP